MITTEDYLRSLINDRNKIMNKIEAHGDSVPSNPTFGELANIYNNTSLLPYDYSPRALFSPNVETIYTVEPQVYLYTKFTNNLSGFYSGLGGGNIQNMDASNATAGVNAFFGVGSLNLNGANFNNMINIDGMFANTGGDTFINNIKFGNVITASNLFNSSNISTIDVNLSNLQNAASMFENCVNLTSVTGNIGDSGSLTNMENMYFGCANLTHIPDVVVRENISSMNRFLTINTSTSLKVPAKFNLDLITNKFSTHTLKNIFSETQVSRVDNFIVQNTEMLGSIICGIFENCKNLTVACNIDLPKNITGGGYRGAYYNLFARANKLTDIVNLNVTGVNEIGGIFRSMVALNNMTFIGDFSNVTDARDAFRESTYCNFFGKEEAAPLRYFPNLINASNMFASSSILRAQADLNLANYFTFEKVVNAASMFYGSPGYTCVNMGNSPIQNAASMFGGMRGLTELPNFKTEYITDAYGLFYNDMNLKNPSSINLNFPNVLTLNNAFFGVGFSDVTLDINQNGVDFSYCFTNSNVSNIHIINSEKGRFSHAFSDAPQIQYINFALDLNGAYLDTQFFRMYNLKVFPNIYNYNEKPTLGRICIDCFNLIDVPIINLSPSTNTTPTSSENVRLAFSNCWSLSDASVVNILTSLANVGPLLGSNCNTANVNGIFYNSNINVLNCGVPEEVLSALNANGWTY